MQAERHYISKRAKTAIKASATVSKNGQKDRKKRTSVGNSDPTPIEEDKILLDSDETDPVEHVIVNAGTDQKESPSNVVYLGRIPHGFYENEMRAFFSQFGKITRLRLSRNKKTGASKHYAFIEFEYAGVAETVTKTMDQYLLKNCLLQCKLVPLSAIHKDMWKGANKPFRPFSFLKQARERHNKTSTQEQLGKQIRRLKKLSSKKQTLLKEMGIDYDMSLICSSNDTSMPLSAPVSL